MRFALLLALACPAWGVVTVSSIAVDTVTYNSARICYTVSPTNSYGYTLYGTASGVYTTGESRDIIGTADGSTGRICHAIGGLAANTAYYFLPTGRPNVGNTTGICQVSGCGAVEQAFTTSAAPSSTPVFPTAPTAYPIPVINTSGYAVVTLAAGVGTKPECVAASTVGPVTAGDTPQTILNEIGYQTIIEVPQGVVCWVPGTGVFNSGYVLTHHTNDAACSAGWIIIRSHQIAAADFPPVGFRTDPVVWGPRYGVWRAKVQESVTTNLGQVFQTDYAGGSSQCYRIENVQMDVDSSVTSGTWGMLLGFGSGPAGDTLSDQVICDRCILRGGTPYGNTTVDTVRGLNLTAKRAAFANSYMDQIGAFGTFAQGVFMSGGGTGPYNLPNDYVSAFGLNVYQEINDGDTPAANDISVTMGAYYWPISQRDTGYNVRQQFEFKGGHRILVQGNFINGCWVFQNECPAVFASGTNDYNASNAGVSDLNASFNVISNVATILDCFGVRPSDNNPGPDEPVTSRFLMANNIAWSLGYANHIGAGGSGGGLINGYMWHRPGCQDLTRDHNTFGFLDSHDTRAASTIDFVPVIDLYGGGATLASALTNTNNIYYMSVGTSAARGRIYNANTEANASFPRLPAILDNTNTPAAILSSYAITATNAGTATAYNWGRNVVIPAQIDTNSNVWRDMTSGESVTYQSGMPSGDTYAAGNTMALREVSGGIPGASTFDYRCVPTAVNSCAAGANIQGIIAAAGIVTNISVVAGPTSLQFSYTAPDSAACAVDTSPNGTTWTRTTDAGGSRSRTLLVSSLAASTPYQWRLMCYFSQSGPWFSLPSEPSNMVTEGTNTTKAAGTSTVTIGYGIATGTLCQTGAAASVKITMTPLVGSAVNGTSNCTGTVSVAGVTNGANSELVQYWSGAGAAGNVVASGTALIP